MARKLKLQVQITVDGYIGGPNGEMDWMIFDWDAGLKKYVTALTESVDCIVLGRKLAEGFIPYWAANPEEEGAEKINSTPKVVFTKTLQTNNWQHTVLAKGNLADEIKTLKEKEGNDIIVYGGAEFVSSLIKEGLIDEYHLFVNPIVIGTGLPIFQKIQTPKHLKLLNTTAFDCGIVALHFESAIK